MSAPPKLNENNALAVISDQLFAPILDKLSSLESRIKALSDRLDKMQASKDDTYLTIEQAAEKYGEKKRTLYYWHANYGLGYKPGKRLKFKDIELKQFIEGRKKR